MCQIQPILLDSIKIFLTCVTYVDKFTSACRIATSNLMRMAFKSSAKLLSASGYSARNIAVLRLNLIDKVNQ